MVFCSCRSARATTAALILGSPGHHLEDKHVVKWPKLLLLLGVNLCDLHVGAHSSWLPTLPLDIPEPGVLG